MIVRVLVAFLSGSSGPQSPGVGHCHDMSGWAQAVHPMNQVTKILIAIEQGDPQAAEQLLPLVYEELRKLAAQKLAQEKPGQTLQATALVHEAYLRLVDVKKAQEWNSRGHFFAAAAEAMRRILIDEARRKRADKRARRAGGSLLTTLTAATLRRMMSSWPSMRR